MNIVACYKIVPDNQDIEVGADGAHRLDRAHGAGRVRPGGHRGGGAGGRRHRRERRAADRRGRALGDTKLVKAALSRGASELYRVVDPALADADAFQTATVLAAALRKIDFDLVVCGEGSADRYSQQVGLLVGSLLGLPVVNATSSMRAARDALWWSACWRTRWRCWRSRFPPWCP